MNDFIFPIFNIHPYLKKTKPLFMSHTKKKNHTHFLKRKKQKKKPSFYSPGDPFFYFKKNTKTNTKNLYKAFNYPSEFNLSGGTLGPKFRWGARGGFYIGDFFLGGKGKL